MEIIFSSITLPPVSSFETIKLFTASKSRQAAHSSADPRAVSKKQQRSAAVKRPLPHRDVQPDGSPGAIQLVMQRTGLLGPFQNCFRPRGKARRLLIHPQLFVVEHLEIKIGITIMIRRRQNSGACDRATRIFSVSTIASIRRKSSGLLVLMSR